MIEERLDNLKLLVEDKSSKISCRTDFDNFKSSVLGPKGLLTEIMKLMSSIPPDEKPIFGKKINATKLIILNHLNSCLEKIEEQELISKIGAAIDPTLESPDANKGLMHPISQIRDQIIELFIRIGFSVSEATELETEYYCFDALNIPIDHPARDMQDSYFMPKSLLVKNVSKKDSEKYLLRTHTSSVQIRTLLNKKPPVRIIAPGRCFRRDTPDSTHSANFHQIEGLYVDKEVNLMDLKSTLDHFIRVLFGSSAKTRLRPSFFPFTEPSFEMDFYSPNLGKLSNKWIEIMGCGMVDPKVLNEVGLDDKEYSGFAFGMGIERISMILQGVDDIRNYYQNDSRFLKQFN